MCSSRNFLVTAVASLSIGCVFLALAAGIRLWFGISSQSSSDVCGLADTYVTRDVTYCDCPSLWPTLDLLGDLAVLFLSFAFVVVLITWYACGDFLWRIHQKRIMQSSSSSSKRVIRIQQKGEPQLSRQIVQEFESGVSVPLIRTRAEVSSKECEDVIGTGGDETRGVRTVTTRVIKHVTTSLGENKTVTETFMSSGDGSELKKIPSSSPEVRSVTRTTTKIIKSDGSSGGGGGGGGTTTTTTTLQKSSSGGTKKSDTTASLKSKTTEKSIAKIVGKKGGDTTKKTGKKPKKISDIITGLSDESVTAREALLNWAQRSTENYHGVKVSNFTNSWKNGLAFNAIIHRNRPDLLDFHSLNAHSARENLEKAFSVAEKEFGVTRLLDAEDVDTPEPDEKSIITYISSLYDVFPEPPYSHPLVEQERHRKVEEYKEQCIRLQMWLLESAHMLQNRAFFNTIPEMKALLMDCSRFRAEDINMHAKEKQKIVQLSKDIQKLSHNLGEITFEGDLKLDAVDKNWELMLAAYHERDQAIRVEITRLEKLQKVADKLSRDLKQCDNKVNDAEKRIKEELKRVQRLQTPDAKHNCEQIGCTLKDIDNHFSAMQKDIHFLFQNNFYQTLDLEKRMTMIHERFLSAKVAFESELLLALSTKPQKEKAEEKIVTKQKAFVCEQRDIELNKASQIIKDHMEYLEKKLISLEKTKDSEWNSDAASVKASLDKQKNEHKLIQSYKKKIDQSSNSLLKSMPSNNQESFCKSLNILEESYKKLLESSSEKLKYLEALSEVLSSATKELKWITEKAEIEITRDWSSKNLNLAEIHHYQECLTRDLEKRERHLTDIQKKGENLLQRHPGQKNIKDSLGQLQEQWSFLLQLACCLEIQLQNSELCHQYFKDGKDCEQFLKNIEERLNTSFNRTVTSVDEGEKILKQVHKIRDDLSQYNKALQSLAQRSLQVTSLKQRRHPISKPVKVMAICNYSKNNVSVLKDSCYMLQDNSRISEWKIVSINDGVESTYKVPSVCFIIPPPSLEIIELYENLKKRHDTVVHTWTVREKTLRQNLIVATIKVVKSWDETQFHSMGVTQRESIIKALNEDTKKLLDESSGEEPMFLQLKSEMENCNKLFQNLQEKSVVDNTKRTPVKKEKNRCEDEIVPLQNELNDKLSCLKSKLNGQIQLNLDDLENLVLEHKDFELCVRAVEERLKEIKLARKLSTKKTKIQLKPYDSIISTWDKIWELSNLYVERLKALEVTIHAYEDTAHIISLTEMKLSSFEKMSSNMEKLQTTHDELMLLQAQILQQQSIPDSLSESFKNVKNLVQLSRPNQTVHCDLNKLENDIKKLFTRWDVISEQIIARLKSCGASSELLKSYLSKSNRDKLWITETSVKLSNLQSVKTMTAKEVEVQVEPVMNVYSSIADQNSSFEHTNLLGARYIREAKIYDLRLKHYKENLEEVHPSLDASLEKRPKFISGAEIVERDLEDLNKLYGKQVQLVLNYLEELKSTFSQNSEFKSAIEENYKICRENTAQLLLWIKKIELRLAGLGLVNEDLSALELQIDTTKALKDELMSQQHLVNTCIDQVRQLVQEGFEILSKEEVHGLQKDLQTVKKRYDLLMTDCDKLLHRLTAAIEELQKFKTEIKIFKEWLMHMQKLYLEKEMNLSNLEALVDNCEKFREFSSDVISHQADIRFITMSAQKFVDESKEYLKILNVLRVNLPERLPHMEPIEGLVKAEVKEITSSFMTLLNNVNKLGDHFTVLCDKHKYFVDTYSKTTSWLNDIQVKAKEALNESISAEPGAIQEQLDNIKTLNSEIVGHERLIENIEESVRSLENSLESFDVEAAEVKDIESCSMNLKKDYDSICQKVSAKIKEIQIALIQSNDISDGLDRLLKWLDETESTYHNHSKSVSLDSQKLDEQIQEFRILQSDVNNQKQSIETVNLAAKKLLDCNPKSAKKIEAKLKAIANRFEKLSNNLLKRELLFQEISTSVRTINTQFLKLEESISAMLEQIENHDVNSEFDVDGFTSVVEHLINQKNIKEDEYDELMKISNDLVMRQDVTDISGFKDKRKNIEHLWKLLCNILDEKQILSRTRIEQLSACETLRQQVTEWLSRMESFVEGLEPISLNFSDLKKQIDEMRPLAKEYHDHSSIIDKLNKLGNTCESTVKEDKQKTSSYKVTSPIKKSSPTKLPDSLPSSPSRGQLSSQSPLSTASSGFGSRKNSTDNFAIIEDLNPIQQQLSVINHRYSLLGVKLNDQSRKLNQLISDVKNTSEVKKMLTKFLEAKKKQLPRDNLPASKEQAESFSKTLKTIQDEIIEKQSELDNFKSQTSQILKGRCNVKGAPEFQQESIEIGEKWEQLRSLLKKNLIFLQDFKNFQDTFTILHSWLLQRQKMFEVLGPIASDPRMVSSQAQQVLVMKDEFSSQTALLENFNQTGIAIKQYLDATGWETKKITEQMTGIHDVWNDLIAHLEERNRNLDNAGNVAKNFYRIQSKLQETLQKINDSFDQCLESSTSVHEQLKRVIELEDDLEKQRPLLTDVDSICEELCEILSDSLTKNDVREKINSLEKLYSALNRKINNRRTELESFLKEDNEFHESCEKFQDWLEKTAKVFLPEILFSADVKKLTIQAQEYEPKYRSFMDKEHELHLLVNKGSDMGKVTGKKSRQGSDQLKTRLENVQNQYEKMKSIALKRHTNLQSCLEYCSKFELVLTQFLPWFEKSEEKLVTIKITSLERPAVIKQINELQVLKTDVTKHIQEFETLRQLGNTLMECCQGDKERLKKQLSGWQKKWEDLNQDMMKKILLFEDVSLRFAEYREKLRDLQHSIQRLEDKITSHDALGNVSQDPILLTRIKSLQHESNENMKQLENIKEFVKKVLLKAATSADTSEINKELDSITEKIRSLHEGLNTRSSNLAMTTKMLSIFNTQTESIQAEIKNLDLILNKMNPVALDKKVILQQVKEIKEFRTMISKLRIMYENAEKHSFDITSKGYPPDARACKEQLSSLKKEITRLEETIKTRESSLETILTRINCFSDHCHKTREELNNIVKEEGSFECIAGDVESIRLQQQAFKRFRNEKIQPVHRMIEECYKMCVGGQVIQSSTNVGTNERELDNLNELWNKLQEKITEREKKLDVAFLQSGKFQEAIDGVQKWLIETEEMVVNQKAPSSDYKVVKAQVQEQKFLKKMLHDRQNSVMSLKVTGTELMQNTATKKEQEQVDGEMNTIIQRFRELNAGADERMILLERTCIVAEEFQNILSPISEWIDKSEKKLITMAIIPVESTRIKKLMMEHKSLQDDITSRKKELDTLKTLSEKLRQSIGKDDFQILDKKMHLLMQKYSDIAETCSNIRRDLNAAEKSLSVFSDKYEKSISGIERSLTHLTKFQTFNVYVDQLEAQIRDLKKLKDHILKEKTDVQLVISTGQEIMKHASGEDTIQVKQKLDTLNIKFSDAFNRIEERQKVSDEMLPLVKSFHQATAKLSKWLESTERTIKTLESICLTTQQTTIKKLQTEIYDNRAVLEIMNHNGPKICHLSQGNDTSLIESMMSKVNHRFDLLTESVQRKAERIELAVQRKFDVVGDIDEILDWFKAIENQIAPAVERGLSPEPTSLMSLLNGQKAMNTDICSQKSRVRDILAAAKKLMRESSTEDLSHIHEKAETLKTLSNNISILSQDRLCMIEQALPLAEHFFETHTDLTEWLDVAEGEAELLEAPALNAVQIKKQQVVFRNKGLFQSLNDHKPLVEKLNKTGFALSKLCKNDETDKVDRILESDNSRYNSLRQVLREHQNALEEALQATSQFSDKLEGMLSALTSTADQIQNAEPISAHPQKIQEQIHDNKVVVQDLEKRTIALEAVKKAADDVIVKAGGIDEPAVKDITKKLDNLNFLWDTITTAARNRGKSLEDALIAAEKFWDELNAVMRALKELKENLSHQESPAVEPSGVQQQQEALLEIKQEITSTKPEVNHCRQAGQDLMQLCGEPDKPEVKKHIEDLDSAWENVTTLYAKREQNLIDAMEKAMNFHDTLHNLFEFLGIAEEKFSTLGTVCADIESVKVQVKQLKDFKAEVDPHMIEVEALNRQAQELVERTLPDKALAIREPLEDINRRWEHLLKGIVNRQQEMENVLLKLGQFQHTLEELVTWITKTEISLDELKPVYGDPHVIEVVLAKHKVLVNDIKAHESSIEAINSAGHQLGDAQKSEVQDVKSTRNKLINLNSRWQQLQEKSFNRQRELEDALKEALEFNQEIQDLLMWISDLDGHLMTSKPVGGLPETAKEQLSRFMEMYNELDSNRHKIENVLQQGQNYSKRSGEGAAKKLQHSLNTLRQRWENVLNKANDKKIKLEIALREAVEFHEALQSFVEWLTNSEKYLTSLKPVSRSMNIVLEQIEDHKNFQKDVGLHREVMMSLDKKGTHLKYFSQKQDVILIKNLLISVQHRWERVVSKAAERTRLLDHAYKEAKEFHDAWTSLSTWLEEAEKTLDTTTHISNDPLKIKQLLGRHKEFQRVLGSKQTLLDTTMKLGRTLKEKSPKSDVQLIQNMMDDIKSRWNRVCSKSVDRQRKLEEALLCSGQFREAVHVLLDWLEKSIAKLAESKNYHGDLDTVTAIMEKHKIFEEELKSHSTSLETLRKTSEGLKNGANSEDLQKISMDMEKLESNWLKLKEMTDSYRSKLEDALKQAEQLHKEVHMLLEFLSDAEMKLRFIGPHSLIEDEETTKSQILLHQEFLKELDIQKVNKDNILNLAQCILKKCHPDALSVVRHYITIIQSRWEEIFSWAKQRDQRLHDHLQSIRDIVKLIEELLAWLIKAETSLTALEAEALPDDVDILQTLIKEHQSFMDDMTKKQPDIEKISKAFSLKTESNLGQSAARDKASKDKSTRFGILSHTAPTKKSPSLKTGVYETNSKHTHTHQKANLLLDKWRQVWLLAMERQRRLQEKLKYLKELQRIKNFDFDEWRKRYLSWMNNKKSRIMDQFRKIDNNSDGKVTKQEFIDGILQSKFTTSHLEMERVSDIFDVNGDGFIDTKEYIDTLRPDKEGEPKTEAEKIQDEVQRQVSKCTCVHRFKVYEVGEGKYRFGDSQKLRLVRILRSTVMVRVGGGWVALDEFLVKNDPCRAKGRTNLELREQFILAEGVSQSMTPFKPKASPNSSVSSQSGMTSRSIPSAGPITKIREKSERSTPMHKVRSADTNSDTSGPSFSEAKSYSNKSGVLSQSSANNRHSETQLKGTKTNSRPSSHQSSHPSSRTASDLSQDGIESYKKGKKVLRDDTASMSKTLGSSTGSKIPFVKRSTTKSEGIEENRKDSISK